MRLAQAIVGTPTWSRLRRLTALPVAIIAFVVHTQWLRYLLLALFALLIAGDLFLEKRAKRRTERRNGVMGQCS